VFWSVPDMAHRTTDLSKNEDRQTTAIDKTPKLAISDSKLNHAKTALALNKLPSYPNNKDLSNDAYIFDKNGIKVLL
jgi:hypothetical protein